MMNNLIQSHCQLSIVNSQLSIVHCPLSIVNCSLSIIHCPLSIVQSIFNSPLSTVHCHLSIVNSPLNDYISEQMVTYQTTILKFARQGEKTGWTYIEVPADIAQKLKPGNKRSFKVKGKLDGFSISAVALLPMGSGNFIMPLNAALRKGIGKRAGAVIHLSLEADHTVYQLNSDLMESLADEKDALAFFHSLTPSHRNYFSKWIEAAKTEETYAKRIALTVNALVRRQGYPEMLRSLKKTRE
jgi:hypothetical protein